MKHQASLTVVLEPDPSSNLAKPPNLDLSSRIIPDDQFLSPQYAPIQQLKKQLEVLIESGRWQEAGPSAVELEKLLRGVSRSGAFVREGWLVLVNLEVIRLRLEKQSGTPLDVTRLQELRKEAESVID